MIIDLCDSESESELEIIGDPHQEIALSNTTTSRSTKFLQALNAKAGAAKLHASQDTQVSSHSSFDADKATSSSSSLSEIDAAPQIPFTSDSTTKVKKKKAAKKLKGAGNLESSANSAATTAAADDANNSISTTSESTSQATIVTKTTKTKKKTKSVPETEAITKSSKDNNNSNKFPQNNNTYFSEVAMIAEEDILCSKHIEKLLGHFTIQNNIGGGGGEGDYLSKLFLSLNNKTKGNNKSDIVSAGTGVTGKVKKAVVTKKRQNELHNLQQMIDKNKLASLTDKRYFHLYLESCLVSSSSLSSIPEVSMADDISCVSTNITSTTNNSNSSSSICIWTHRKIELGGSCHLGKLHSTVFPVVAVVFSAPRFVQLVFQDIDKWNTTTTNNNSSSSRSNGDYSDTVDFQSLKNEIISIRRNITQLFHQSPSGSSSSESSGVAGSAITAAAEPRVTLVVEDIQLAAMSYISSYQSCQQRQQQQQQTLNGSNSGSSGSGNNYTLSIFERLDDAIACLIHEIGLDVVQLRNRAEVYEYLHSVSKTLAESVYRKKTTNLDCQKKRSMTSLMAASATATANISSTTAGDINGEGDGMGVSKINNSSSNTTTTTSSNGNSKNEVHYSWINMLETLPQMSRTRAAAFAKNYSCPLAVLTRIQQQQLLQAQQQQQHEELKEKEKQSSVITSSSSSSSSSLYEQMMAGANRKPPSVVVTEIANDNNNNNNNNKRKKVEKQLPLPLLFQKDFTTSNNAHNDASTAAATSTTATNNKVLSQILYKMMTCSDPLEKLTDG